jgi:hypothetical protein
LQRVALRAKIVLRAAEGLGNQEIARLPGITGATVGKWRERYRKQGMEGLSDESRPGATRSITDARWKKRLRARWKMRRRERRTGAPDLWLPRWDSAKPRWYVSGMPSVCSRTGARPSGSQPIRSSSRKFLVEKVRDIAGLYLNPPDKAIVLCVDEKSQIQALDRTQPILPMTPGLPERRTSDYERHGTTSLFAALDIASGKLIGRRHRRHRHQEFLKFMDMVDSKLPREAGQVHIVLDNYSTHKTAKVLRWFARHPRYYLHFTPASGSSINQVERGFAEIPRKRIRRGSFTNVRGLEPAIKATWIITMRTPSRSSGPPTLI